MGVEFMVVVAMDGLMVVRGSVCFFVRRLEKSWFNSRNWLAVVVVLLFRREIESEPMRLGSLLSSRFFSSYAGCVVYYNQLRGYSIYGASRPKSQHSNRFQESLCSSLFAPRHNGWSSGSPSNIIPLVQLET
jgi:hypothetical protein